MNGAAFPLGFLLFVSGVALVVLLIQSFRYQDGRKTLAVGLAILGVAMAFSAVVLGAAFGSN